MSHAFELTIRRRRGWQAVHFKEVYLYPGLLAFLIGRDIKTRCRQTLPGGQWAIPQPFITMLVFIFIFNRMAGVKSDGPPYPLFAYAGLAWSFLFDLGKPVEQQPHRQPTTGLTGLVPAGFHTVPGNRCATAGSGLIPRPVGGNDALLRWPVTPALLWLPVLPVAAVLTAADAGLTLSALNVSFRDMKPAVPGADWSVPDPGLSGARSFTATADSAGVKSQGRGGDRIPSTAAGERGSLGSGGAVAGSERRVVHFWVAGLETRFADFI